jgi:hypothetical protein
MWDLKNMESMVLTKLNGCYEDKQSLRRSETEIQFIIGKYSGDPVAAETRLFSYRETRKSVAAGLTLLAACWRRNRLRTQLLAAVRSSSSLPSQTTSVSWERRGD